MSDARATAVPPLVIRRTFAAPRARVYAAWTDLDLLPQWLGPPGFTAGDVRADTRVGGTYSYTIVSDDGESLTMKGTFTEIKPPERIAYTFRWEEDDPADEIETNITLDFLDRGNATELIFTQAGFASPESRQGHNGGWNGVFDKFALVL